MYSGQVRFKRTKNRDVDDIFRNTIRPKIPLAMDVIAQKVVHHSRQSSNYRYEDQTGALTESKSWIPAKQRGATIRSIVLAGGQSKATRTYTQKVVFYQDDQGRLRVFEPKDPNVIRKGDQIYVDYAVFIENKGMNVLKMSIEVHRKLIARLLAGQLRLKKIPRMYRYKNTDKAVNIHG